MEFEGKSYIYVPFDFQIGRKQSDKMPADSANKIPEASFNLVLRKIDVNNYDIALHTKLYAVHLSNDSLTKENNLENYYTITGDWINSWFYKGTDNSSEKIFKSSPATNSSSIASPNLYEPNCTIYSVTTYETQCYSDGGPYNGTTCTSVPVTEYYTFCSGGGGGSMGGGGGNSPPTNPSQPQTPCAAAQPAVDNANNTAKTTGYTNGLNAVKSAPKDGKEHGVALNRNSSGVISSSALYNDNQTSVNIPVGSNTVATTHSHPGNLPPSSADMYSLISSNKQHSSLTTKYVTLPNGDMYALVITNPALASAFAQTYPSVQTGSYAPDFPDELADGVS